MSHIESSQEGHGSHDAGVDREVNGRAIAWSIIGTVLVVAISMLLMVWMMNSMLRSRAAGNPPPSPLAEANAPWIPPGPALQEFPPTVDLGELEAREDAILTTYGWVDESARVVRIPLAQALRVVEEGGFPERGDIEAMSAELFGGEAPAPGEGEMP